MYYGHDANIYEKVTSVISWNCPNIVMACCATTCIIVMKPLIGLMITCDNS